MKPSAVSSRTGFGVRAKTPRGCGRFVLAWYSWPGRVLWLGALVVLPAQANWAGPETGTASWYGEQHRGRLMSNGRPFNPDKLTAASWFYPLGTRVRVTLAEGGQPRRSVVVTITDRGPAWELVRKGRIIDLSQAAFQHLADGSAGLVPVTAEALKGVERRHDLVAACGSTSTAVAIKPAMGKENAQPKLRLVRDY